MAKRFGGPHSPNGPTETPRKLPTGNRFRGAHVAAPDIRPKLLYIAPLPLIIKALGAEPVVMAQYLLALFLIIAAAWLTAEGQKAEIAYHKRNVARPPAVPRKIFAAVAMALGLFTLGLAGYGMMNAIIFGIVGGALHLLAFGIDPLRKKGMEGMSAFDTERVAKAVEKAEAVLSETLAAAKRFGDRTLEGRVESLAGAAREMFRAVEEDPRDLSGARKFMGIYLKGTRDATIKFADLYAKTKDQQARSDYEALLSDMEASFDAQRVKMLEDTRTDLDVEIEVLRERLQREGVRSTQSEI